VQHQYTILALPDTSPTPETARHASGCGAALSCPYCNTPLSLEGSQAGGHLSDPEAHALIDHLLLIESELAQIRRLLLEEIGL
jgi:hypothetical protein